MALLQDSLASTTFRRATQIRLWTVPLFAAILLAVIGLISNRWLNDAVRQKTSDGMKGILDTNINALQNWLENEQRVAEGIAVQDQIRKIVGELITLADSSGNTPDVLKDSRQSKTLRTQLEDFCGVHEFIDFAVLSLDGVVVAASLEEVVGKEIAEQGKAFLPQIQAGNSIVSRPVISELPMRDEDGQIRTGVGVMFVAAPVRDENGEVIAGLSFRLPPERGFSNILSISRIGDSVEIYAFNSDGLMISESRFDNQMREMGLLPDDPDSSSVLTLEIRDPGGNLVEGYEPRLPRREQPLTKMATAAIRGEDGIDVRGYRDYRGVRVVGVWKWLSEYGFGVAVEYDFKEAYAYRIILRRAFFLIFGFLVLTAIGMILYSQSAFVLSGKLKRAQQEVMQLGQYTLGEKIGEGGMGSVYVASHAMLRRPTAVKLIREDDGDARSIARFEREVQTTSRLTHPNTIAIYDFGRTPEGVFYYAMEYLPGISLKELVEKYGPQPEARIIYILQQVCSSLQEAHSASLIHRDIKPANIMLCERGGLFDVVKVLDFGLVKSVEQELGLELTAANVVAGTPHYLSPEAIEDPAAGLDNRSDLYALGAVGYFLMTGRNVFEGENLMKICAQHLNAAPTSPSVRLGRTLAPDLENAILKCLEKRPDDRPMDADALSRMLGGCKDAGNWGPDEAKAWWMEHPELVNTDATDPSQSSDPSALTIAVDMEEESDPGDETIARET